MLHVLLSFEKLQAMDVMCAICISTLHSMYIYIYLYIAFICLYIYKCISHAYINAKASIAHILVIITPSYSQQKPKKN